MTADMNELRRRMEGAVKSLHSEFSGLRTGRANAALLDHIQVEAYGSTTPLNQVGNISVPEPHMLSVQVWDGTLIKNVEKAINSAGLGVNAIADGALVRVPIPPLSQERREELSKIAGKYAENAKVSVRNVRRDGNDTIKKMEKDNEISKDELKKQEGDIQKLTDEFIKTIDDALSVKEKEILGN
ncbi:MAG: ribosome recycling factor [Rickettsiales bacterium]